MGYRGENEYSFFYLTIEKFPQKKNFSLRNYTFHVIFFTFSSPEHRISDRTKRASLVIYRKYLLHRVFIFWLARYDGIPVSIGSCLQRQSAPQGARRTALPTALTQPTSSTQPHSTLLLFFRSFRSSSCTRKRGHAARATAIVAHRFFRRFFGSSPPRPTGV